MKTSEIVMREMGRKRGKKRKKKKNKPFMELMALPIGLSLLISAVLMLFQLSKEASHPETIQFVAYFIIFTFFSGWFMGRYWKEIIKSRFYY